MNTSPWLGLRGLALARRRMVSVVSAVLVLYAAAPAFAAGDQDPVSVTVLQNTPDRIVLRFDIAGHEMHPVVINGQRFTHLNLGGEPLMMNVGEPALPKACRSVIIPDDARMVVTVLDSSFREIRNIDIAPSKGSILRTINPDDVPYTFGKVYRTDAEYPGPLVELSEPYILRHHRGTVVRAYPFQYNPVTRTLRAYTRMTVELSRVGSGEVNVLTRRHNRPEASLSFHQLYAGHFINYTPDGRYTPLDETGDMLIIAHDAWLANVQPLADHKNARSIPTTVVGVSTVGNNAAAIMSYIQGVYNTSDLAFVLLVGDGAHVATPFAVGGSSDPSYALVFGSDTYPDIFVGRFSAETPAHVDTQVLRTIEYENLPAIGQDWYWKGTGIASNEGPGDDGEYDYQHIDNIRTDLINFGFTQVDQIYDPGATASEVTAALNEGRGVINYCGHGGPTSWGSTGFSNSHVNSLVNNNMLPWITSVACVNGQFEGQTCFAESWLRATNGGEPTGAIGMYASSIDQYWNEPMAAEDEIIDLLCAEAYGCYGALSYAGSCLMMDEYGSSGVDMFKTWHIFGDPSLAVGGPAGPRPPTASSIEVSTNVNAPVSIVLPASDDGLPDPPALALSVLSLPGHGTLADPAAGEITTVPYALGTGNVVEYTPSAWYGGLDSFEFQASDGGVPPDGGDSNIATVSITVGGPTAVQSASLDVDPGWAVQGEWQFGQPSGQGGTYGSPDPSAGATGDNVYGVNLNGDHSTTVGPPYFLTAGPFDCGSYTDTELRFMRWLNSDYQPYVFATIEVSTDGTVWTAIWDNGTSEIAESSWSLQTYDISALVDGADAVWIRWGYQVATNGAFAYSGWNIDDVEIWAVTPVVPGDCDGNGQVDLDDFAILRGCLTGPGADVEPGCTTSDLDLDGHVDMDDFALFEAAFTGAL